MSDDFNDFLREKQLEKEDTVNKIEIRINEHVSSILKFYQLIREWLFEYENNNSVSILERVSPFLNENLTELMIKINDEVILFTPEFKHYDNDSLIRGTLHHFKNPLDESFTLELENGNWYIKDKTTIGSKNNELVNKETFLNLIKKYL